MWKYLPKLHKSVKNIQTSFRRLLDVFCTSNGRLLDVFWTSLRHACCTGYNRDLIFLNLLWTSFRSLLEFCAVWVDTLNKYFLRSEALLNGKMHIPEIAIFLINFKKKCVCIVHYKKLMFNMKLLLISPIYLLKIKLFTFNLSQVYLQLNKKFLCMQSCNMLYF